MSLPRLLKPGSTIGMLGGGQLGRMAALAAAQLGYHMHVFAQDGDEPAVEVCRAATIAPWTDEAALARFANSVDAITIEFENVPVEAAAFLAGLKPLHPGVNTLAIARTASGKRLSCKVRGLRPWHGPGSKPHRT